MSFFFGRQEWYEWIEASALMDEFSADLVEPSLNSLSIRDDLKTPTLTISKEARMDQTSQSDTATGQGTSDLQQAPANIGQCSSAQTKPQVFFVEDTSKTPMFSAANQKFETAGRLSTKQRELYSQMRNYFKEMLSDETNKSQTCNEISWIIKFSESKNADELEALLFERLHEHYMGGCLDWSASADSSREATDEVFKITKPSKRERPESKQAGVNSRGRGGGISQPRFGGNDVNQPANWKSERDDLRFGRWGVAARGAAARGTSGRGGWRNLSQY